MDKRIIKTKRALKTALIELLHKKNFEKIRTTEICDRALVSRNTFYNYYADKYALLEDCFATYEETFIHHFDETQRESNPELDRETSFRNLIDTFLDLESDYEGIPLLSSFDLTSLYYRSMTNILEHYEEQAKTFINPSYDLHQLNSFLTLGFWGFVHENPSADREKIRKDCHRLCEDLFQSAIFQKEDGTSASRKVQSSVRTSARTSAGEKLPGEAKRSIQNHPKKEDLS